MTAVDAGTINAGATRRGDGRGRGTGRGPRRVRDGLTAYGLVAPNVLLLGLFVFVPLVDAVIISFQNTTGFGGSRFIGFANYSNLFSDPVFWRATGNTVLFTAIVTPLSMGLGLALAGLLNSVLPARGLFRSILIIPMAVSGVATATLGELILDQNFGLLDELLRSVGIGAVDWQSSSVPAFVSIVVVTLWWRVGINMLVYLAGLQGLDPQLREAATLDGAGPVQRFRFVVLPALRPTSFFLVIMNIIYSFQAFDIVYVLSGGGTRGATSLLVTYAYNTAFVTRDQGYAAAIGMVLLLFTAAVTAARWQLGRGRDV